jgi:hypothetical protein
MYLAPLNYDRYFKKVFSDLEISKQFLSDFLDVEIESIEMLDNIHKLTDKSNFVEFDFRCKINGKYVIIDMQQWYKSDIVKRFYVYHCANTVLQLEHLLFKEYAVMHEENAEKRRARAYSYHSIEPVITLIWMVDDTLNFKDDYITYSTYPQNLANFILQDELWEDNNTSILLQKRAEIAKILQNQSKNLDFLPENTMTYLFQKNIVRNKHYAKYVRWFNFAEKTIDKNNTPDDFQEFLQDKTFLEIMRRINKEVLQDDDFGYIRTQEERQEERERWLREERLQWMPEWKAEAREEVKEEVREEVKEEVREEVKEEVREEVKEEVREEVKEEVREEVKEEVREEVKEEVLYNLVRQMLTNGETPENIAKYTGLPIQKIKNLVV